MWQLKLFTVVEFRSGVDESVLARKLLVCSVCVESQTDSTGTNQGPAQ